MTAIHKGSRHVAARDVSVPRGAHWGDSAECRRVDDPDLFFPKGGATARLAKAKAVCGRCPVREQCLRDALDREVDDGVLGGLSEEERRAMHGRPELGHQRPGTPRRALTIAADPGEFLRLAGEGLSPFEIATALRTNVQTVNEVGRLLAEREDAAAPDEGSAA